MAAAARPRIAIVGAGISGLTAALVLQDRGIRATVYESSARVGGRMHSLPYFWDDGQTSEWCGELTDTAHTTMHALTRRFGLRNVDVLAAQPRGAEMTQYFDGKYYFWRDAERDFRPVYAELQRQLKTLGETTTWNSATPHARELDHMSAYDWIERYVPGGHRSPMGQFLDVSYLAEYGIDTRKQSALNLVYYVGPQPAYNAANGDFSILGVSDQRYHIVGGNQQLPLRIAGALPDGALLLRHRLVGIDRRPDGRVALTFETPDGTRVETVEKAIVTPSFAVLRTIDLRRAGFDARKMRAIQTLGYGEHSKFVVQFDERWWNHRGPWGISTGDITTDLDIVNAWEQSRGQPGKAGLIVQYPAGAASAALHPPAPYTMSIGSPLIGGYAAHLVSQLNRVWPGIAKHYTGKAALSHPSLDPNFRGSYSCWLVGQCTSIAGYEGVRQGNVLFAGEHCNVVYQGFMEGAAREGVRAAREVLHDLGMRAAA
ncbi:MAG: FAD-dependent oxidoreductase [Candidatus Eremiobacteraeota bacterium]|nr:FAD-dependent oxidoreductase [Candidatus Eremiobacteraeota bacterium]